MKIGNIYIGENISIIDNDGYIQFNDIENNKSLSNLAGGSNNDYYSRQEIDGYYNTHNTWFSVVDMLKYPSGLTEQNQGSNNNLGCVFVPISEGITITGVKFWANLYYAVTSRNYKCELWRQSDGVLLQHKSITAYENNAFEVLFDTPYVIPSSETYKKFIVSVYCTNSNYVQDFSSHPINTFRTNFKNGYIYIDNFSTLSVGDILPATLNGNFFNPVEPIITMNHFPI